MGVNGLTFGANDALLNDTNVFIAASGATSDTTVYEIGITNKKRASDRDSITDASGINVMGKTIRNLKGIVCNKYGKEIKNATINDVVHLPGSSFNLFSLTKRLEDEWILGRNSTAICLEKGGNKITFDIKIKTPKGALFCIYFKRNSDVAAMATNNTKPMSTKTAHEVTGHIESNDNKEK